MSRPARWSSASEAGIKGHCPGPMSDQEAMFVTVALDKGRIQRPGILLAEGTSLEQLFDEGGLLLQLQDLLTLLVTSCVRSRFCYFSVRWSAAASQMLGVRWGPGQGMGALRRLRAEQLPQAIS